MTKNKFYFYIKDLCNEPKASLPKGNSPVRGNVCKADKRVAVSARKLDFCVAKRLRDSII